MASIGYFSGLVEKIHSTFYKQNNQCEISVEIFIILFYGKNEL